jgi:hypothetical protein
MTKTTVKLLSTERYVTVSARLDSLATSVQRAARTYKTLNTKRLHGHRRLVHGWTVTNAGLTLVHTARLAATVALDEVLGRDGQ